MNDYATGADCYFRVNGQKVAHVESWSVSKNRNVRVHGSCGAKEATGFSEGMTEYQISITRAYMADGTDSSLSFKNLKDFEFVVEKPGKKDIYSPCRVSAEDEKGEYNDRIMEDVTILALRHREEKR